MISVLSAVPSDITITTVMHPLCVAHEEHTTDTYVSFTRELQRQLRLYRLLYMYMHM